MHAQAIERVLVYLQSAMINGPDGSKLVVCNMCEVLGLSESGNKSTNPHFNNENSPRTQFQALQQAVRAKENGALTR